MSCASELQRCPNRAMQEAAAAESCPCPSLLPFFFTPKPLMMPRLPPPPPSGQQMLYKVFEPAELKPVLDAVNADMTKEKEKENK